MRTHTNRRRGNWMWRPPNLTANALYPPDTKAENQTRVAIFLRETAKISILKLPQYKSIRWCKKHNHYAHSKEE